MRFTCEVYGCFPAGMSLAAFVRFVYVHIKLYISILVTSSQSTSIRFDIYFIHFYILMLVIIFFLFKFFYFFILFFTTFFFFFFFNDPAPPEFSPFPLPDALPISGSGGGRSPAARPRCSRGSCAGRARRCRRSSARGRWPRPTAPIPPAPAPRTSCRSAFI